MQQEGYELLETHDGQGALVIVDYMVKTSLGNLQVRYGLAGRVDDSTQCQQQCDTFNQQCTYMLADLWAQALAPLIDC